MDPQGASIPSTASKLTFVSSAQLSYQFDDGSDPGNWSVTVNSADGTQHSNAWNFTVTPGARTITSLSPPSYPSMAGNQTMLINGANFVNGDTLTFVHPQGATIASTASKLTFVSSSQFTYQFNNANDPAPGRLRSTARTARSTPTLELHGDGGSANDQQRVADLLSVKAGNQTLTINGANFQSGDTLTFVPPEGGDHCQHGQQAHLRFQQPVHLSVQQRQRSGHLDGDGEQPRRHPALQRRQLHGDARDATPSRSLSPTSYAGVQRNQTLTINGANFQNGDTLTFVDPQGATIASTASKLTFVSSSQLTYQFNNGNDSGTWTVTVNSPTAPSTPTPGTSR